MTGFGFLILFGCVVLPACEGQIKLPTGGKRLIFAPRSTAKIEWTFNVAKMSGVEDRTWYFTSSDGTLQEEKLAEIERNDDPVILNSSLTGVAVEKPATLVLRNVNQSYDGTYAFSLKAGFDGGLSKVTVIIAVTPTVIVSCSSVTTVTKGDNFVCECKGEGGRPPANVTWHDKDGIKIGETGVEKETLTLINVNKTDRGTYTCVAKSHELAKNDTSIELIVNFSAENVRVVFPTTIAERGKPFTITCEADAHPPPKFKIFYNETKLLISQKTYIIPEANNSHTGFYKCVAKNKLGSSNSTSRYLHVVNEGRSLTTFPTSKTSNETVETHTSNHKKKGLGAGAIVGIIIGVLVLVVIIVGVIYWFKFKSKKKDREEEGNADVKLMNPRHADANVYDAVPPGGDDGGASASTSKVPHEYATLEPPMTYATLDTVAMQPSGSKKQSDREELTQYASIEVGKVGKVSEN